MLAATSTASAPRDSDALIELKAQEADEVQLFKQGGKLFSFDKTNIEWKERGHGEMRLMLNKTTGKVRVLMRRDKTHTVCANHLVTEDMKLQPNVGSDRSWVWTAKGDYSDETIKTEMLAVRFPTAPLANRFKAKFDECQAWNAALIAGTAHAGDANAPKPDDDGTHEVPPTPAGNAPPSIPEPAAAKHEEPTPVERAIPEPEPEQHKHEEVKHEEAAAVPAPADVEEHKHEEPAAAAAPAPEAHHEEAKPAEETPAAHAEPAAEAPKAEETHHHEEHKHEEAQRPRRRTTRRSSTKTRPRLRRPTTTRSPSTRTRPRPRKRTTRRPRSTRMRPRPTSTPHTRRSPRSLPPRPQRPLRRPHRPSTPNMLPRSTPLRTLPRPMRLPRSMPPRSMRTPRVKPRSPRSTQRPPRSTSRPRSTTTLRPRPRRTPNRRVAGWSR
ncbi:hypothetical protein AMAG_04695 [Allomyces macrogynus ATCC 38327]|uniref:Ran-specific GTPase-activating protein n=1 Tax=Allomyces macrogynus (strain ATCC 38327) TaxID=578462 RepID=A0A0L0S5X1_ALLM3|nr:hypothetical protein AMAG_04695 [Allomyces macrogynus ATCC 38327]|eukprot:KNE57850.1 hypothetical protein AMAG_04695 [Allomyces macrogynus ATCC 38327]